MVIVTGATGFIGRRVVPLARDYFPSEEIVCLIKENLNDWEKRGEKIIKNSKVKIIEADIRDYNNLKNMLRFPRLLIHLAATTDTSELDYSCNDIGTKNLYKSFGKLGPKTHVIYTGTTAIMAGRKDCSKHFDESSKPQPTNEYGRTKLNAEEFLIEKCKKDKFRLTIARLTTVYGNDPRRNSLFDMMKKMVLKKSLEARLNWPGLTGLIHVSDVASAILMLSLKPPQPGKPQTMILNSELLAFTDIIKLIHQALGINYHPVKLPMLFWKTLSKTRPLIYASEKLLPSKIYHMFWRISLIVDNVIYCQNGKFLEKLPKLKLQTLQNTIKEVIR